jgi:hypothetical protein
VVAALAARFGRRTHAGSQSGSAGRRARVKALARPPLASADRRAPLALSTWKVPGDGDWQGVLIVIEMPAKDRRSLMLRAESSTGFGY